MKFNKSNYKVFHLLLGNTMHTEWEEFTESSPVEKDLGVLVDEKLNKSQQCVPTAQEASHILGCTKRLASRLREGILLFFFAFMRPCLGYCLLGTRKTWICKSRSRRQLQRCSKGWSTSPMKTDCENLGCSTWKRKGVKVT